MTDLKPTTSSAKELFQPIKKKSSFSRRAKILIALFLCFSIALVWFLAAASAVLVRPDPSHTQTRITHWLKLPLGQDVLMLPGRYTVEANAPGYFPYEQDFELGKENFELTIKMEKLPGQLQLQVFDSWQKTPLESAVDARLENNKGAHQAVLNGDHWLFKDVPAGLYTLHLSHDLYTPLQSNIEINGKEEVQQLRLGLQANYGQLFVDHPNPNGQLHINEVAQELDAQSLANTGLALAIGDYDICLEATGFKRHCQWLEVKPQQQYKLQFPELLPADASLELSSNPLGANVLVNGEFRGRTPLNLALEPNQTHQLKLYKDGYQRFNKTITLNEKESSRLHAKLNAQLGKVSFLLSPANSTVKLGGKVLKLDNNGLISLPSHPVTVRIEAPGYASQTRKITPNQHRPLKLDIKLLTLEQQKFANLKEQYQSPGGQTLKLFKPNNQFTMGASRREQGRRANEAQRRVKLDKPFYLGTHEVSNKQFRQFRASHNSKHSKGVSLNSDNYPVANISWEEAALYCNWLSKKEGLQSVYTVSNAKVTGFKEAANGYRLPTETEWAWAARYQNGKMSKYAWGERMQHSSTKANYQGNYADRSAASQVGSIINNYDDGFAASAPSGKFKANALGLFDMGGNMGEWMHDVYGITTGLGQQTEHNPMGKQQGNYYVIRGPSWASGTMSDLRLAFRDYGSAGKRHVGFRIARSAL